MTAVNAEFPGLLYRSGIAVFLRENYEFARAFLGTDAIPLAFAGINFYQAHKNISYVVF